MTTLLVIVWTHFFADFVLQTNQMAQNKSTSNYWLSLHVLVYMIPFVVTLGPAFALVNGLLHLLVDWCTSRINSQLWREGKVHYFFVGVGVDQAIHMTCLIVTAVYLRLL